MKILHPEYLWMAGGLILLIVLWIVRPQREKKAVSSVWLWRLSERFHSKRMPLHRVKKMLQLLLQLFAVSAAVLLALRPVFRVPDAGKEYIAVVDVSAGMGMNGRLEKAKESLLRDISSRGAGTEVTVIAAGSGAVTLLEKSTNRNEIEHAVARLQIDWGTMNVQAAAETVQRMLDGNPEAEIMWYTGRALESDEIVLQQTGDGDCWNAAVNRLSCSRQGVTTTFEAEIVSYNAAAELTCALYLDERIAGARQVLLNANEPAVVEWDIKNASFAAARVVFAAQDALQEDNEALLVMPAEHAVRVLLCSDEPFFWQQVLRAFDTVQLEVRGAAQWEDTFENYDIYVFDGTLPKVLPSDGGIWMIHPDRLPRETGLLFGAYQQGGYLELPRGGAQRRLQLENALISRDIVVQKLHQINDTERFEIALTAGGQPALLAMRESNGLARVIFSFDLHDSNLPLTGDFVLIVGQLLDYTMPELMNDTTVNAGETVKAAVTPLAKEIYLKQPDGTLKALPFTPDSVQFLPVQPGMHTLMQLKENGMLQYVDFVCRIPPRESDPRAGEAQTVSLVRVALTEEEKNARAEQTDRMRDIGTELAAVLLLLLLLEWMVYYHEQY